MTRGRIAATMPHVKHAIADQILFVRWRTREVPGMCSDTRMSRRDDAIVTTGTDDIGGLRAERGDVCIEGGSRNKDLDGS
jgi:hypothetical protein